MHYFKVNYCPAKLQYKCHILGSLFQNIAIVLQNGWNILRTDSEQRSNINNKYKHLHKHKHLTACKILKTNLRADPGKNYSHTHIQIYKHTGKYTYEDTKDNKLKRLKPSDSKRMILKSLKITDLQELPRSTKILERIMHKAMSTHVDLLYYSTRIVFDRLNKEKKIQFGGT